MTTDDVRLGDDGECLVGDAAKVLKGGLARLAPADAAELAALEKERLGRLGRLERIGRALVAPKQCVMSLLTGVAGRLRQFVAFPQDETFVWRESVTSYAAELRVPGCVAVTIAVRATEAGDPGKVLWAAEPAPFLVEAPEPGGGTRTVQLAFLNEAVAFARLCWLRERLPGARAEPATATTPAAC